MKPKEKKYILDNAAKKSPKEIAKDLGLKERRVRRFIEEGLKHKKSAPSPQATGPSVNKKVIILSIALIIILGLAVYANSLGGKFLWDDSNLIVNNVYIGNWSNLPKFLVNTIGYGAGVKSNSYRPFQMFTYFFDYSCWKLNPFGYHITNVILHILAALALYWLINTLFGNSALSLFTAALFAVHPVNTEAVSYISGRADPLAAVFILLSFVFYVKQYVRDDIKGCFLCVLSYLFALFSKENSLILPLLLLLYHSAFRVRPKIKALLPILIVTLGYIFLRATVLNFAEFNEGFQGALFERIPGFFAAITTYLRLLILPIDLHMEYTYKLFSFTDPRVLFGAAASVVLVVYALMNKRKHDLIFFSVFWFFITLLPQSNLYPTNAYLAEHWLYLPSIGFFLILAKVIYGSSERLNIRYAGIAAMLVLISFYSYLTIRQNYYWKEPVAFYERTLRYAPDSKRLCNDLGTAYFFNGKYEKAAELFKRSIEIDPSGASSYNNLGGVYNKLGKNEEAVVLFKKATELSPDLTDAYFNLANTYQSLKDHNEAIAFYKKTIGINPAYAKAYNNLGVSYMEIGDVQQAIEVYKKAIEISPDFGAVHNNLAAAYSQIGEYRLAIKHCDTALALGVKVSPHLLDVLRPHR